MGGDEPLEVEVGELAEWTTGYSDEDRAVALILRSADGQQLGVMMDPNEAMAMASQLTRMALCARPPANTP